MTLTVTVLPISRIGDDARQILHLADGLAVELDDHVARLDAGLLGGPGRRHFGDERALHLAEIEALGEVVGHRLDAHAEPAAPRLAIFA